jgi:DNA repair exonuclease SbcCD ATPase subunit
MMTVGELSIKVERLKGQQQQVNKQLRETRVSLGHAKSELGVTEEAQALIQLVAKETQDQLRYHITELGSMALEAVFGEGISLDLEFMEKRGKTEARLVFMRGDKPTDPLEADSGGAADIAALALRCSLWSMKRPRLRAVMVLDEPLKNINDGTRGMQERAAEMIKQISEKLGMQFLIVTMLPELEEIADKVFRL